VIEPIDDDERDQLIRELLVERFGPRRRAGEPPQDIARIDETPQDIARRRRVLCGLDKREAA
jgi:hypothetical protein